MGKMLENNGDIEKAMTYFSAALEKSKQLKYRKGEADSYLNISGYYYRKEDLETSKLNIDKALGLCLCSILRFLSLLFCNNILKY